MVISIKITLISVSKLAPFLKDIAEIELELKKDLPDTQINVEVVIS